MKNGTLLLLATLLGEIAVAHPPEGKEKKWPREFTFTGKDGKTQTLTLKGPPQRIASLTLGTDENLLDLVDPKRIVAMTEISQQAYISNVAGRVPKHPVFVEKDSAKVVAAKPDLVLVATYIDRRLVEPLLAAGLPVYEFSEFRGIASNRKNLLTLGELVGEEEKAAEIARRMDETLKRAGRKKWPRKMRAVYFSEGRIFGDGTTPSEVVRAAGLADAAAEFGIRGTAEATPELIANLKPDVILIGEDSEEAEEETRKLFRSAAYQEIPAAKAGRVYAIPGKHITTVSWNIVKAVEDIQRMVQP